jgi:acyl CoA:acetate/3-ketoacid CoA transferase beta subunit
LCFDDHYGIGRFLLCNNSLRFGTNVKQGVFDVDFATGLTLVEIADGVTVEEIKSKTEAPFKVADDLKPML